MKTTSPASDWDAPAAPETGVSFDAPNPPTPEQSDTSDSADRPGRAPTRTRGTRNIDPVLAGQRAVLRRVAQLETADPATLGLLAGILGLSTVSPATIVGATLGHTRGGAIARTEALVRLVGTDPFQAAVTMMSLDRAELAAVWAVIRRLNPDRKHTGLDQSPAKAATTVAGALAALDDSQRITLTAAADALT